MRIGVVGTGLIGASIASGLASTHEVSFLEPDESRAAEFLRRFPRTQRATSLESIAQSLELAVVCTPVGAIAEIARALLTSGSAVVTDVGSVKAPVLLALQDLPLEQKQRFVGGHPMSGSEQDGLAGASATLFQDAIWVTTPTFDTAPESLARVNLMITELGAQPMMLAAQEHDSLVAVVSHVPQLVASSLMGFAADQSDQNALTRIAAGGFRDMTRIAASHPAIWPDICVANREAILRALDGFAERIVQLRGLVDVGDRDGLLTMLEHSRAARRSLPVSAVIEGPITEIRVAIPDVPGVLAEITGVASRLNVNILDIETAHSSEGGRGILVLVVRDVESEAFAAGLAEAGYRASMQGIPEANVEEA